MNWATIYRFPFHKFVNNFFVIQVSLYLSGHGSAYERTFPTFRGKETEKDFLHPHATVYINAPPLEGIGEGGEGGEGGGGGRHDTDKPKLVSAILEGVHGKLV